LQVLRTFPSNMVDSVVTDPPYGLSREPDIREVLAKWLSGEEYQHQDKGFMGMSWDSFVPSPKVWREVYRVLKPGGHALIFAGTRTQDLMTISLRLAGFEVRDVIEWLYFNGFPKSLDVGKAIDSMERGKLVSAKIRYFREARGLSMSELAALIGVGTNNIHDWEVGGHAPSERRWNEIKGKLGVSDEEEQMFERTVIGEVEKLNSFSCEGDYRVGGRYEKKIIRITAPATDLAQKWNGWGTSLKPAHEPIILVRKPLEGTVARNVERYGTGALNIDGCRVKEKFPANCVTVDSISLLAFNITEPKLSKKATRKDRDSDWRGKEVVKNNHPTVKPTALMTWLVRLITPPGGIVLDPFAGSGSTCVAARREGFFFIGIERELEYVEIARKRVGEIDTVPEVQLTLF